VAYRISDDLNQSRRPGPSQLVGQRTALFLDTSDSVPLSEYRASKQRFDEDEGFKTRAREAVTKLQSGDKESLAAWNRICDASRREFAAIYDRLGVSLEERGESFYNPMLPGIVTQLEETGILEESDGAKVVWTDKGKEGVPPLMVRKSDGGFGYAR
jgi:arginyl-tRNA synthetase